MKANHKVGPLLKRARERAGMEQVDAATAVGVHKMTVSRWERGVQKVPAEALRALLTLYGLTHEELYALTEGAQRVGGNVARATPGRLSEPLSPTYAGLFFNTPIAAQKSRLWLEGFLLELAESGADVGFLERLEAGVRAIAAERNPGLQLGDATQEAADAGRGRTGKSKEK